MLLPLVAMALTQSSDPATWGKEVLTQIRSAYYLPQTKLFAERPDRKQPAFNWGVGVMLSALNAASRFDPAYRPWLREFADATRIYWNQGGYDVLPAPKPLDRYYDDNAWMALALAETYEVLGDRKYLDWAKGALDYALSGEAQDGGIFWREKDRASRNTCSCGPTAMAALVLARHLKAPALRERAERIVSWTRTHLQDPADGLFWDSLGNDGKLDRTKWTYNSALMIRAMRELGMKEADRVSIAAKARWLKDGKVHDPGRFAHLLVEAWIESEGATSEMFAAVRSVYVARRKDNLWPVQWGTLEGQHNPELLDQAALARACFMLALAGRK